MTRPRLRLSAVIWQVTQLSNLTPAAHEISRLENQFSPVIHKIIIVIRLTRALIGGKITIIGVMNRLARAAALVKTTVLENVASQPHNQPQVRIVLYRRIWEPRVCVFVAACAISFPLGLARVASPTPTSPIPHLPSRRDLHHAKSMLYGV